jgi:hypothetical protein
MPAGIVAGEDRGAVGYVVDLGHHWHGCPEYIELDGEVPMPTVREKLSYNVVKVPLGFNILPEVPTVADKSGAVVNVPNPLLAYPKLVHGMPANMCALVRTDTGRILHEVSVSPGFGVYQNEEFVDRLDKGLFAKYPNLSVESCGTLWGGRIAFINIMLNKYRIKGDDSETIDRLMFYNVFGGKSDAACVHSTRIVCWNTLQMAAIQGKLNETLRKFRHTSGIVERVEQYLIDLSELQKVIDAYNQAIEALAFMQMDTEDVGNFLGNMFPIDSKMSKKMMTGRKNKQDEILNVFETAPDLQGKIARSRYAMLQAETFVAQHVLPEDSEVVDDAFAWWDVAAGGTRNDRNQKALKLLMEPNIPEAPKLALAA